MTPNEYQNLAIRTLLDRPEVDLSPKETMIIWNIVGLAGEVGEFVDYIKKGIFHRHGINLEIASKELGDILWYVAALCSKLDLSLEDVMQQNIVKLEARYPDGFKSSDSINRKDK